MIYVGIDWSEHHHDICITGEYGAVREEFRVADDAAGIHELQRRLSAVEASANEVVIGVETGRGLAVRSLRAAGFQVIAINPLASSRYRGAQSTAGAKSDKADAKLLAEFVRVNRSRLRPISGDSSYAEAIRVLARAQTIASRLQRQEVGVLRSTLRDYYPAALDAFSDRLQGRDSLAVLAIAPTPSQARKLSVSRIREALSDAGRMRNLDKRALQIHEALTAEQLSTPIALENAYGEVVRASLEMLHSHNDRLATLEYVISGTLEMHPDIDIFRSMPGLGDVLAARILGEFGDDRERFTSTRGRRNFAGMAPVMRSSGMTAEARIRRSRNRYLSDALLRWSFLSIINSPGAHRYYDELRGRGKRHWTATRQLANRWVGILHGCLESRELYREEVAWPQVSQSAQHL